VDEAGSRVRAEDRVDYGEEDVRRAAECLRQRLPVVPRVGLVLGSGLGAYANGLDHAIPFSEVPGLAGASVSGHEGRFVFGVRAGVPVAVQSGRFHVYEGMSAARVALPVRVLKALGAGVLVVTNASGGVTSRLEAGDLLVLEDHVHLQFRSPLRGRGPLVDATRFVDLSHPYAPRWIDLALETARCLGIPRVFSGTYASVLGPSYETPAEIRMLRELGADAVGMSTVPEVLTARQLGMEVLGLSAIANLAAGVGAERLTHEDVLRAAALAAERMTLLLDALLPDLVA
jgi:purine-nucleoside phosphorylase